VSTPARRRSVSCPETQRRVHAWLVFSSPNHSAHGRHGDMATTQHGRLTALALALARRRGHRRRRRRRRRRVPPTRPTIDVRSAARQGLRAWPIALQPRPRSLTCRSAACCWPRRHLHLASLASERAPASPSESWRRVGLSAACPSMPPPSPAPARVRVTFSRSRSRSRSKGHPCTPCPNETGPVGKTLHASSRPTAIIQRPWLPVSPCPEHGGNDTGSREHSSRSFISFPRTLSPRPLVPLSPRRPFGALADLPSRPLAGSPTAPCAMQCRPHRISISMFGRLSTGPSLTAMTASASTCMSALVPLALRVRALHQQPCANHDYHPTRPLRPQASAIGHLQHVLACLPSNFAAILVRHLPSAATLYTVNTWPSTMPPAARQRGITCHLETALKPVI
jgi:hypothetical protein